MNEERRWRDAGVVEMIERMDKIESAAQILVKKKGRHNTEVAYQPLVVALEKISELLDRLEAAEKSDAESIAMYRKARDERDALRAKVEAMERQKPVGKFAQHPSNGLWEQDGYGDNPEARPLYALPGADVFELHPRLDAMAKEAARYRLLRAHRPGLLLDILDEPPNPNERNALHLDREIDARLALPSEDNPSPASGRPDQP